MNYTKMPRYYFLNVILTRSFKYLSLALVLLTFSPATSFSSEIRSQTIQLVPGWNAVYVELDPLETFPADLFEGMPVDVVAGFSSAAKPAQFVVDPSADLLKSYGWTVWYAPRRADHFLSNLSAVQGGKPYLIHATTNASLVIQGTIAPDLFDWTPDAFNFVGFSVVDPGGPTFAEFFSGSTAHHTNKIYRMVNGTWRLVTDPSAAVMRSGEAFWIYCQGSSSYKGPVSIDAGFHGGVVLSPATPSQLIIRNRMAHPVSVTLEHLVDAAAPVPLASSMTVYDLENSLILQAGVPLGNDAWTLALPPLEAGAGVKFPLMLDREHADFESRTSIIRATTDLGTITYVPVSAFGLTTAANE